MKNNSLPIFKQNIHNEGNKQNRKTQTPNPQHVIHNPSIPWVCVCWCLHKLVLYLVGAFCCWDKFAGQTWPVLLEIFLQAFFCAVRKWGSLNPELCQCLLFQNHWKEKKKKIMRGIMKSFMAQIMKKTKQNVLLESGTLTDSQMATCYICGSYHHECCYAILQWWRFPDPMAARTKKTTHHICIMFLRLPELFERH